MKDNYTIDHDMYLMNHKNGDVLKVTVNNKDKSLKNLQLYRQDGLEITTMTKLTVKASR